MTVCIDLSISMATKIVGHIVEQVAIEYYYYYYYFIIYEIIILYTWLSHSKTHSV